MSMRRRRLRVLRQFSREGEEKTRLPGIDSDGSGISVY
jgi:hypothetical protein